MGSNWPKEIHTLTPVPDSPDSECRLPVGDNGGFASVGSLPCSISCDSSAGTLLFSSATVSFFVSAICCVVTTADKSPCPFGVSAVFSGFPGTSPTDVVIAMDVGLATDVVIAHGVAMATVVAIAVAGVTKAVPAVVTMLSVFSCAGVSVVWEGESVATAAVLSLQVAGSNCEYYKTRTQKNQI